jgi:hypothetical protein
LPRLKKLLAEISEHLPHEEGVYRFYHQSFKVYNLQAATLRVVAELQAVMPNRSLNSDFMKIIAEGTGKKFRLSHNKKWHLHTRPIVEAFFHAKHMLEMLCKCGENLKTPPMPMPYDWATVLYLYNLR